jgi:hypothetical protein
LRIWQLLEIVQSAGDGGLEATGEASGSGAGGSYPLDVLGRVRTRGDLAALINAGLDNITIKTEICCQGDEPMDDEDDNEVICIVGLDESNHIISLDDPFQTD